MIHSRVLKLTNFEYNTKVGTCAREVYVWGLWWWRRGWCPRPPPSTSSSEGCFLPPAQQIPVITQNQANEHNFLNFLESFPFGKAYCTVCTRMDFQLKSLMMATWYQWTCFQIGVHRAPNVRILSLEEPKWEGTTVWKSRKVALWGDVGLIGTPNDRMARRRARCRANQSEDSQETK